VSCAWGDGIQESGDTAPLVLHAALLPKQEPKTPIAYEVGGGPGRFGDDGGINGLTPTDI
jgi:hypothetical protein